MLAAEFDSSIVRFFWIGLILHLAGLAVGCDRQRWGIGRLLAKTYLEAAITVVDCADHSSIAFRDAVWTVGRVQPSIKNPKSVQ
jgi:hypothetical protein